MMAAQKLYEKGYITYMRTDSVNLSLESMLGAKKMIEEKFGQKYALPNPRFFKINPKGRRKPTKLSVRLIRKNIPTS